MKKCSFLNVTNLERKLPYFIHGAATDYDQEDVYRPQGCPWFQLNICKKGKGYFKIDGCETVIEEGDSIIIFPGVIHEYYPVNGKMVVSWIAFNGFQVKSMFNYIGINKSGIYKLIDNCEIHESIKKTMSIEKMDLAAQGYNGSQLIYNFLLTLKKNFNPDNSEKTEFTINKLKPALDYMKNNISDPISIENISETMRISPQHFCMIFKTIMDQRPFEYLNSLRINYSKNLLINQTDFPINKISEKSGYPNHSYFCKLFKAAEGITPVAFKKLYGHKK